MKRLLTGAAVVPLVLSMLVDGLSTGPPVVVVVTSVAAVATMWIAYRVSRATPGVDVLVAVGLCVAASTVVVVAGVHSFSLAECWSLVVLAGVCAARSHRPPEFTLTAIVAAAAIAVPVTLGNVDLVVFVLASATATVTALGIGFLIRVQALRVAEERRTVAARERGNMARELHDVIAHEVTGIVVLAQAASRATKEPTIRDALGRIEASGLRALDEVRSMVTALRAPDAGAVPEPLSPQGSDVASLRNLVDEFAYGVPADVRVRIDEISLPPHTAIVAHRILGEALTNVRRHGRDARTVEVSVERTGDSVVLRVSDDGTGQTGVGSGGGYGLLGIEERAHLVGGTVRAGRGEDGRWTVVATLPNEEDGGR